MNKKIMKTLVAGLVCLAFCGTAFAYPPAEGRPAGGAAGGAPGCGNGGRTHQKAPARQTPNPGRNGGRHVPEPAHCGAPVAHHAPAPCRHEPPPPPHCGEPHGGTGLVALGAAVVGGVVGGIVGACR